MKTFGARQQGGRLERIQDSPPWADDGFRNRHRFAAGLCDLSAARPTMGAFLRSDKHRAFFSGGAFLPVYWGTFSPALHALDEPAETLLDIGPPPGASLLMPQLGEPIEPAREDPIEAWWRGVDRRPRGQRVTEVPAPILPKSMPWWIDLNLIR